MTKLTLTMLDTSGIQNYIFNSNRMQENIGASEIVYRATTLWAFEELPSPHNVVIAGTKWTLGDGDIEKAGSTLQAEVIYAGGGNTLILFKTMDDARAFTTRITRRVLERAPGLNLLASHLEFKFDSASLADLRLELIRQLAARKQSRLPSLPLLGLGVSAVCQSTGLPAIGTNRNLRPSPEEEIRLISRETRAKLIARDNGNQRLQDALGNYSFPYDIDKLGRVKGEESYVAVVHTDGNRMGEHLDEAIRGKKDNRELIQMLRKFSTDVNDASLEALRRVVTKLVTAIQNDTEEDPQEEDYLPFRPLVFGGDDVTFLCNGQLGLTLAVEYLNAFEETTKGHHLEDFHASAGISIVKMHYPFARAYALSEQLLSSAKRFAQSPEVGGAYHSALDWNFATGGLSGSLGVIREREYMDGSLLMRPLLLHKNEAAHGRYWEEGVERVIHKFRTEEPWKSSHNKVVGLRDVLRDNSGERARAYLRDYELGNLPELIKGEPQQTGWSNGRCVYFDAIELLDHHLTMDEQKQKEEEKV